MTRIQGITRTQLRRREDDFAALVDTSLRLVADGLAATIGRSVLRAAGDVSGASADDLSAVRGAWSTQVEDKLAPEVAATYHEAGAKVQRGLTSAGHSVGGVSNVIAHDYLRGATNRLNGISDELWTQMRGQLVEGFQAGESIDKLSARIRAAADMTAGRADAVARTEINGAANRGSLEVALLANDATVSATKEWLSNSDGRTRPAHRAAAGQVVTLTSPFQVDGESLDCPGDFEHGSAGNIVNCRCSMAYDFVDRPTAQANASQGAQVNVLGDVGQLVSLADHVKTGIDPDIEPVQLGGGSMAKVDVVTFNDGAKAVRKVDRGYMRNNMRDDSDAEELASKLGDLLDVKTPSVVRDSKTTVYMDVIDGKTPDELFMGYRSSTDAQIVKWLETEDGRKLGLFDAIIGNIDRNTGNWLIADDGIYAIDNGAAFMEWDIKNVHPLAYVTIGNNYPAVHLLGQWASGAGIGTFNYTVADIAYARERVEMMRPDFIRLRHKKWYDAVIKRLDVLAGLARGTVGLW